MTDQMTDGMTDRQPKSAFQSGALILILHFSCTPDGRFLLFLPYLTYPIPTNEKEIEQPHIGRQVT